MSGRRTFSAPTFELEHVPETHRTLNNDHTVTVEDLPGMVNLYLVVDGGRVLLDQFKAGKIFDAIELAKQKQAEPPPPPNG